MNPNQPAPASDASAMSAIIQSLPPAPTPSILDFGDTVRSDIINPAEITPPLPPAPTPPAPPVQNYPVVPTPGGYQAPAPAPLPPAPDPVAPPAPATPPDTIPLTPLAPAQVAPPAVDPTVAALIEQNKKLIEQLNAAPATSAPASSEEWKPQGWQDVDARIAELVQKGVEQGLSKVESERQAQVQAEQELKDNAEAYIDNQIAQLETLNYLPKITNPNDPNDPGRLAHRELFSYAVALGTDNLMAVAPTLYAHHQNGYYYDPEKSVLVRKGSQSAAAQAPIAGANPSITPGNANAGPTMLDLHNKDLHTLAEEANARLSAS